MGNTARVTPIGKRHSLLNQVSGRRNMGQTITEGGQWMRQDMVDVSIDSESVTKSQNELREMAQTQNGASRFGTRGKSVF